MDAMSVLWSRVLRYAFPPEVLIPRVLDKIRSDETTVVLIAVGGQTVGGSRSCSTA